jgi:hypothetical protein
VATAAARRIVLAAAVFGDLESARIAASFLRQMRVEFHPEIR